MYNVSNEYKSALKFMAHRITLTGRIDNIAINDDNVLDGSLSVVKRCSEGSEVKIGSVYTARLKCTFLNVNISRGTWKGKQIEISEGLLVGNNYEYVPIGVFFVDDAVYHAKGIEVTAYDNMAKLDKTFPADTIQGTAWSIFSTICTDCGVPNGMTKAQIEALPNGTASLSMYTENDAETYRDVLSWLTQTLSAFAYADRDGSIKVKKYSSEIIDIIDTKERFDSSSFSDFSTRYTGMSVVDIETQKTNYYSVDPDNGLTYNLGSNPFLQLGTGTTKKLMREAVLNGLQAIDYTPFQAEWSTYAVYDLGDVIQFKNGRGANAKCCIMYLEWKYKSKTTIKGFGSDPSLASARSKTDKNISGLMSKTDENGIQYYTYMNTEEINIADGARQSIASLRFTTMQTKKVTFQAEVLVDVETQDEAEITVIYQLDGAELRYKPVETWRDGKHILSLWYVIEVEPNTLFRWQVFLETSGGSVHIDAENSRAAIWGQGLVAIGVWDGYIDAEDRFTAIPIDDSISLAPFTDEAELELVEWIDIQAEDTVSAIPVDDSIEVAPFEDSVYIDKTSLYFEGFTWGDIKDELWGDVLDEHVW